MTLQRNIILALLCLVVCATAESASLQKHVVRNAASRQAVCNDGSPAVYYFRAGKAAGLDNWVVFLGGGGFCFSVTSCKLREETMPDLMTSRGKPATLVLQGLLSDAPAANPDFFNANHVVIPYCSSDLWSGDREKGQATGGYEFRGRKILQSVVQDLRNSVQPGARSISSAKRILLGGTSAGGAGTMVNLDWMDAQFPAADVRGLNDGGWIPPIPSLPGLPSVGGLVENAVRLWNGKPDASCAVAQPDNLSTCYQSTVYPYIHAPLMVQESQYDTWVLRILQVRYPYNPTEQFVADLFAAEVRRSLQPVRAAFSPKTQTHGLAPYTRFSSVKIDGVPLRRVLGNWFFDRPGAIKLVQ